MLRDSESEPPKTDDYDDPELEERWCDERRAEVSEYLKGERISHGRVGEWPAWHVAPYVSIWAIESVERPEWVGWWVICGDLPTDFVSATSIKKPREVVRAFATEWADVAEHMLRGEPHPETTIGSPEYWAELGPLLKARAEILADLAVDDSIWDDDGGMAPQ